MVIWTATGEGGRGDTQYLILEAYKERQQQIDLYVKDTFRQSLPLLRKAILFMEKPDNLLTEK